MNGNSKYLQVFITVPDKATARKIAKILLENRLVACVQVLGPITSSYWWQNTIENAREYLCIAKTCRRHFPRLKDTVEELHPYETPEIIGVSIATGAPGYLTWLAHELTRSRRRR